MVSVSTILGTLLFPDSSSSFSLFSETTSSQSASDDSLCQCIQIGFPVSIPIFQHQKRARQFHAFVYRKIWTKLFHRRVKNNLPCPLYPPYSHLNVKSLTISDVETLSLIHNRTYLTNDFLYFNSNFRIIAASND